MPGLNLKPAHKAVTAYYDSLAQFEKLGIRHETAVRSAFQELLEHCARQFDWKLVPEYPIKRKGQADAKADGALLDNYGLNHGLWEAKDSADDLDKEIKNKFSVGYPKQNILFWQPDRAVLYQNGERFRWRVRGGTHQPCEDFVGKGDRPCKTLAALSRSSSGIVSTAT
jgi:hypothetical protein